MKKYLLISDKILLDLLRREDMRVDYIRSACLKSSVSYSSVFSAIQYYIEPSVTDVNGEPITYKLNAEGHRFVQNGGYAERYKQQASDRAYKEDQRDYNKKSLWISLIALVISVISIILAFYCR